MSEKNEGQCPSILIGRPGSRGTSIVFCTKKKNHKGDHRGIRAQWRGQKRVQITESLSL